METIEAIKQTTQGSPWVTPVQQPGGAAWSDGPAPKVVI